jgi:hypothetical protein
MPSDRPWVVVDNDLYNKNRGKYGHDELRPYAGEWLAWSLDGSTILAHHADVMEVDRQLREAGIDTARVVMERMPDAAHFDECAI